MNKKILASLIMVLFFAAGCTTSPKVPTQELLGVSDESLVSARGEGEAVSYEIRGESVTQQRKYDEELFGMSAQVEYMFSDDENVAQIVATFPGVDKEELINAVSYHLDTSPIIVQNESEEFDFMARWEKDGIFYIARRIPDSSYYVLIEKQKS